MGAMFGISSSCEYLTTSTNNISYGIISLVLSFLLTIPPAKHYLRVSVIKDFDFINIFMQCGILKSTIFAILTFIYYLSIFYDIFSGQ